MKIVVYNPDNEEEKEKMAKSIHLMRNIVLTFDSFVNTPYPIHVFKYHREVLFN